MFPDSISGPIEPNTIVLKIQPDEGMSLTFQTKQPGTKVCLNPVQMTYSYPRGVLLDAYEWVMLDCMLGDHMLFMREDSVELAWSPPHPAARDRSNRTAERSALDLSRRLGRARRGAAPDRTGRPQLEAAVTRPARVGR